MSIVFMQVFWIYELSLKYCFSDWDLKLQQTMVEMFPLNSADAAYTKIRAMLSTLGDPFTRIISPKVSNFNSLISSCVNANAK